MAGHKLYQGKWQSVRYLRRNWRARQCFCAATGSPVTPRLPVVDPSWVGTPGRVKIDNLSNDPLTVGTPSPNCKFLTSKWFLVLSCSSERHVCTELQRSVVAGEPAVVLQMFHSVLDVLVNHWGKTNKNPPSSKWSNGRSNSITTNCIENYIKDIRGPSVDKCDSHSWYCRWNI